MRRFLFLSGLAYALLLLGLLTLQGALLALALPLVIYLGAALLCGPEKIQLVATRSLSADRAFEGAPVAVRVIVRNEGARLEEVSITDYVPEHLEQLEGETALLAALAPGETVELAYTVRGKRGCLPFGDVAVTARDHLGLFQRQATLAAPAELLVLPRATRVRRVAIRPQRTRAYAGPVPARQGGSGVEFFGVREYQTGDPLRWINWRTSTRHPQTLFTTEFEQERIADVGLILDARQRSDVRCAADSLFEHAVRATASLAETFLNDGNRVGLLIYGGFLDWTFPGYGKVQRERILRALARAETGESLIFDKLEYLPTRFFPAHSQLVLVSPLSADDPDTLLRLRAHGYQVLVISPDPVAFEARALVAQPATGLAVRIARLERILCIRQLLGAGIPVVDWPVEQPFDQAVHSALGRTPPRLRGVGVPR